MKFVNPRNDVAFKKIFGNEHQPSILISFLNAVLDLRGDREIQSLEFLNPYQAPKLEDLKDTTLDVRARDKRGVTFIVEMQVEPRRGYEKRFLYYASKAYVGQIERGEDYPRLNQVIFIGILDFAAFMGTDYLTRHLILNARTQVQELKDLEFTFIELPKFTKDEAELETLLEKWIYFIKHASDLEMVPASADHAALRAAYDIANTFGWSRNELEVYEYWSMRVQDERGAIEFAEERGVRRGRQEGEVVGLQRGKEETARKMLAKGYDVAEVADLTGLTREEVAALVGAATLPPEA